MEIVAVAGQKLVEQGLLGVIVVLQAAAIVYLYRRVEALQKAFTDHLKDESRQFGTVLAANTEVLRVVVAGQEKASAGSQAIAQSLAVLNEVLRRT